MATPASAWKEKNRTDVTLPSGNVVTIRKLTADFLFAIQEIAEKSISAGEMGDTPRVTIREQRDYIQTLVRESVVSPKIVPNTQTPKDDEMWVNDFGSDLDPLVAEINKFNSDVIKVPFRSDTPGETPAHSGEGVRGEPEPVAEATLRGPDV